jgi:hypothetical protein
MRYQRVRSSSKKHFAYSSLSSSQYVFKSGNNNNVDEYFFRERECLGSDGSLPIIPISKFCTNFFHSGPFNKFFDQTWNIILEHPQKLLQDKNIVNLFVIYICFISKITNWPDQAIQNFSQIFEFSNISYHKDCNSSRFSSDPGLKLC